jgi:hypothetical protein
VQSPPQYEIFLVRGSQVAKILPEASFYRECEAHACRVGNPKIGDAVVINAELAGSIPIVLCIYAQYPLGVAG